MSTFVHISRSGASRSGLKSAGLEPQAQSPDRIVATAAVAAQTVVTTLTDWFIPAKVRSARTDQEIARLFVFTHLFGPLIAQPLWIYLWFVTPDPGSELAVIAMATCSFWLLPFVLRTFGSMWMVSIGSFQLLAMASLYGTYHYGGFASPFLPWLVVSLLLGLCYLSRNTGLVLGLFAVNLATFFAVTWWRPFPSTTPIANLSVLGWLSISSATVYVTWMALYYSRIVGLRSELEGEAERSRATLEELERARPVAETTGRARSRFFAKASHELRTPLNVIINYSEILLDELEDEPDESESYVERVQDVRRINAAGKHLLSLVSYVLDQDMIERDAARAEIQRFRLGELCDEVMANAMPMVERNNNRFAAFCPHRDFMLSTDPKKLRQILINLLSNAGKFTTNGTVTLDLAIRSGLHDKSLIAVVADTGIGISEEALPRLFTEYEQGDASVRATYGGTGIGLSLSRSFANLLGGDITVASTPGQGSRFTVTVPTSLPVEVDPETDGSTADAHANVGALTSG